MDRAKDAVTQAANQAWAVPRPLSLRLRKKHGQCQSRKLLSGTKQAALAKSAVLPQSQIPNCLQIATTIGTQVAHAFANSNSRPPQPSTIQFAHPARSITNSNLQPPQPSTNRIPHPEFEFANSNLYHP